MAKYKDYTELSAAFKSGELGPHYYIMLDKGGMEACLNYFNPDESDAENERHQVECRQLFEIEYAETIEGLFKALGIPAQWC